MLVCVGTRHLFSTLGPIVYCTDAKMTVVVMVFAYQMDAVVTLVGEDRRVKTLHALLTADRMGYAMLISVRADKVSLALVASGPISTLPHKLSLHAQKASQCYVRTALALCLSEVVFCGRNMAPTIPKVGTLVIMIHQQYRPLDLYLVPTPITLMQSTMEMKILFGRVESVTPSVTSTCQS